MKLTNLIAPVAALALAFPVTSAAEQLSLTFSRTGSTVGSVSVAASGIAGVQASMTNVTPASLLTSCPSTVICANVNGNTSPNITMEFTVTGLPEGFKYDNIGLDIHALNAGGAYQQPDDNKKRQWNVSISTGSSTSSLNAFSSLSNIDIADGVNVGSSTRNKVWNFAGTDAVSATNPLVIRLTITKGTSNEGCFFGLSSITLSSDDGGVVIPPVDPPVEPTPNVYTIKWKNNTTSYMAEMPNGGIEIVNYSPTQRIFWEFIPTENDNCYYIRNCATGNYIGSCNYTPSSASKISMSATPVEYYMGNSASTYGDNKGCVWLSSTDCANYNRESSSARCLNKDGASSSIITWSTGTSNVGSYWTLTPSANLYEPQPFTPAASLGSATAFYQIVNEAGAALTHSMAWDVRANVSEQKWYFVGVSNSAGGYQIVDAATNTPINGGAKYLIAEKNGFYEFSAANGGQVLELAGETLFTFASVAADRTPTSLRLGLYSMPCGSLSSMWFTTVESGSFRYPLPVLSNNVITYPVAGKPSNKYTIFTHNTLRYGSEVTATLNAEPVAGFRAAVYFDWDGDGVFEDMRELPIARTMTFTVARSEEKEGATLPANTRMRLKVTGNGLMDADDEVAGHVMDFKVNCVAAELQLPTVGVNARNRGTAKVDARNRQAIAAPKGTSAFVCWKEGHTFISTQSTMDIEEKAAPVHYTAVFSPNLDDDDAEVSSIINVEAEDMTVSMDADRVIRVTSSEPVRRIYVFNLNGVIARSCSDNSVLSLEGLESGVYVVKAVGTTGTATTKVVL